MLKSLLWVVGKGLIFLDLLQKGKFGPDGLTCGWCSHGQVCQQCGVLCGVHSEQAVYGILFIRALAVLHPHLVILLHLLVTPLKLQLLAVQHFALFISLPIQLANGALFILQRAHLTI